MNITWCMDEGEPIEGSTERTERRLAEVIIKLTPDEDPYGFLTGLLWHRRLEAFLQVFARPADHGAAGYTAGDFLDLLSAFGYISCHVRSHLEGMMLTARDQFGLSWGIIATAVGRPRQTVRNHIIAARRESAACGHWYDHDGLHSGTGAGGTCGNRRP